jgi:hypothetical protein
METSQTQSPEKSDGQSSGNETRLATLLAHKKLLEDMPVMDRGAHLDWQNIMEELSDPDLYPIPDRFKEKPKEAKPVDIETVE